MLTTNEPFHPMDLVAAIWAPHQLPDLRLFRRLETTVAMWMRRLEAPTAQQPRAQRRGAQRFFRNQRIDPDELAAQGQKRAASLLRGMSLVLVAHDTCEVNLNGPYLPDDAGPLRSSRARGYMVHNSFAIDPEQGSLLAMVSSFAWTRSWQMRHQDHKARRPQNKESVKWRKGIRRTEKHLEEVGVEARRLHLMDSEGDIHTNFTVARRNKWSVLVRAAQDRNIRQGPGKLWAYLKQQEPLTQWETTLRTSASAAAIQAARQQAEQSVAAAVQQAAEQTQQASIAGGMTPSEAAKRADKVRRKLLRQAQEAADKELRARVAELGEQRNVVLEVRTAQVHLTPANGKGRPVRLQAVYLKEVNPPEGVDPVDWMLLTTAEIEDAEGAVMMGRWYRSRYGIEEVHKVEKTGLHLEQEVFDDIRSFRRFLAVAGPVATQIVRWRDAARSDPQQEALEHVDESVLGMLAEACQYKKIPLPSREWTVEDFVLCLALVGGYEQRRGRRPGWFVIWRGWRRLQEFAGIFNYAKSKKRGQASKKCVPP